MPLQLPLQQMLLMLMLALLLPLMLLPPLPLLLITVEAVEAEMKAVEAVVAVEVWALMMAPAMIPLLLVEPILVQKVVPVPLLNMVDVL
jgi:hypothetical protein